MPRRLLLVLLLPLAACQGNATRHSTTTSSTDASSPRSFNQDTVQTFDIQTGEFQQRPPYGARSNQPQ
jgi:hypothetical protein